MVIRLDLAGVDSNHVRICASPLAELAEYLHVLASPEHHRESASWVKEARESLSPSLASSLDELAPLWSRYRARFWYPLSLPEAHASPQNRSLTTELDALAALAAHDFVPLAANAILGKIGHWESAESVLLSSTWRTDCHARAAARGRLADQLITDHHGLQERIVATLRLCEEHFFAHAWTTTRSTLEHATIRLQQRLKNAGVPEVLASVSLSGSSDAQSAVVKFDKLQTANRVVGNDGIILIASLRSWPHTTVKLDSGLPVIVQFPVAEISSSDALTPAHIGERMRMLADPGWWDLCRHLLSEPMTTSELSRRTGQSPPSISRHLSRMREAGLVTSIRSGRHVYHRMESSVVTRLGADLIRLFLR